MTCRPLVAANWKMNGLKASIADLEKIIAGARNLAAVDLVVCPPATLITGFAAKAQGTAVAIGGQDCHAELAGAYTGDISAEMLRDAGATAVIVGHSERRRYHGETDAAVRAKALAARRAGLLAIICIGETRAERDAGHTRDVLGTQLDGSLTDDGENIAIAYEPIWAIGTGVTPTRDDVGGTHAFIRRDCRRALLRSAATRAFSMAARSSQATQETCSESKTLMGRLSVGQASMATNFWRLPACTAISETQVHSRSLRAKSHRNATADRVETSRFPI